MNVIETVKQTIDNYPQICELSVDYIENKTDTFAIYSVGDSLIKEDMLGNQLRQHSFLFNAFFDSYTDYDRLTNNGWLLEFALWVEQQTGQSITVTDSRKGNITAITTANGMLYDVPTSITGGIMYQLQINAQYTLNK